MNFGIDSPRTEKSLQNFRIACRNLLTCKTRGTGVVNGLGNRDGKPATTETELFDDVCRLEGLENDVFTNDSDISDCNDIEADYWARKDFRPMAQVISGRI